MPHTTTKRARTKRPDFRPNGKRRLQAQQRKQEKDRLARVAANELKGKLFAPLRHEPLPKISNNTATTNNNSNRNRAQILRKAKPNSKDSSNIRFRALHKLLRQIVALEEKQTAGTKLDEAQLAKLGRFDEVVEELEEMQRALDEDDDEEEDDEGEAEEDGMDEEEEADDGDNEE